MSENGGDQERRIRALLFDLYDFLLRESIDTGRGPTFDDWEAFLGLMNRLRRELRYTEGERD